MFLLPTFVLVVRDGKHPPAELLAGNLPVVFTGRAVEAYDAAVLPVRHAEELALLGQG